MFVSKTYSGCAFLDKGAFDFQSEEYQPNDNIWGLNKWGVVSMSRRLEEKSGLPCNSYVFRRTSPVSSGRPGLT
jgi:hypothetical protein